MKRFLGIIAAACLGVLYFPFINAQVGGSYYSNFTFKQHISSGQIFGMTQDAQGNMLMAGLRGVIVFDGAQSSLVGTGSFPFALQYSEKHQKTYVACEGLVGYIQQNHFAQFEFVKTELPAQMQSQIFNSVVLHDDQAYFLGDNVVVKTGQDPKKFSVWNAPSGEYFTGIFQFAGKVFVNVADRGLHTLESNGKLLKISADDKLIAPHNIIFCIPRGTGEVILGADNNQLYVFSGSLLVPFENASVAYFMGKEISDGKDIDNQYMIISTSSGGMVIVNKFTGQTNEMFNTGRGFPDDEIYCLTVDRQKGIWAAHEFGVTRIDRFLPVKNYSSYPGINSRIYSVAEVNGSVIAGTADGLYYLKSAESAAEYESAIKTTENVQRAIKQKTAAEARQSAGSGAKIEPLPSITPRSSATPLGTPTDPNGSVSNDGNAPGSNNTNPDPNADSKGTKVKSFIRKKLKEGGTYFQKEKTDQKNPEGGLLNHGRPSVFRNIANNNNQVQAQYLYKRVSGLDAKVKKLLPAAPGVLCVTTEGLYLFDGRNVRPLFVGAGVNDVAGPDEKGDYYFITSGSLHKWAVNENKLLDVPLQIQKNLYSIMLHRGKAWIGSLNKVESIDLNSKAPGTIINIPSSLPDFISVARKKDQVVFLCAGGVYEYAQGKKDAVPSQMKEQFPEEIVEFVTHNFGNGFLIKTIEGWKESGNENEWKNQNLLDILSGVRYVQKVGENDFWVVSGDDKIYKVKKELLSGAGGQSFEVFIRSVMGMNGKPFDLYNLSIKYNEAALEFRWAAPGFMQSDANWYQFKIEGSPFKEWSNWTRQTSFKIQLKPGKYKFIVRAKNILGLISKEKILAFEVKPPFWQTWWFSTLVVLAVAAGVYFFFMWRNKALIENQRRLEEMVKKRTEELAIEKDKAEKLLLNILPKSVAKELQESGKSSVRTHQFSSVMFTDFVDFTKKSKGISPEELVKHLDNYFAHFDSIVKKYGVEKIKTIGDAYMCASGVPESKENSAVALILVALEVLDFVKKERERNPHSWDIRIGIHSGRLVSGVVGREKFAYDIWGDTVNVASRMENSGAAMEINISETTYDLVKNYFECEFRGEIEAKSLGKTKMYFVKSIKKQFTQGQLEGVPSTELLSII